MASRATRSICYERTCTQPAVTSRLVLVGGTLETMWSCPEHVGTCLEIDCTHEATEQRLLRVNGKLERLRACLRHSEPNHPRSLWALARRAVG
jgi:hypothetical protein